MAQLSLRVLGSIDIARDGAPLSGLESGKVRALLIYLAVEPPRPHTREVLATLLWPEQPSPTAHHNLRQALANLRQSLHDRDIDQPLLLITREAIQRNPDCDYALDVADFAALLAACETHPHRHANVCQSCAERRSRAVSLYGGDFLAHLNVRDSAPFDEWVARWRERLHQQAVGALASLTVYHAARGAYGEAQCYARRHVELDPWNEEANRHLMRALWYGGQQDAALAQYAHCRRILQQELGLDPTPETIALYQQIRVAERDAAPQIRSVRQLPVPPTSLIGREAELAHLAALLDRADCRLITLCGPGGIGKTRLALRAATDQAFSFADGVHFVALASLHTADLLAPTIAAALTLVLDSRDDPALQIVRYLRDKELLLVLDNAEHLLGPPAEVATLLATLLQEVPRMTLLVTSRERLHLQGEWVVDVVGLSYPTEEEERRQAEAVQPRETPHPPSTDMYPALELFLHRARCVRADFALTMEEARWATHICRTLEGMPLAIELAAAWVRVLTCQEIAREIAQGLDVLAGGLHDLPARHRSVRAVLDHSWRLLTPDEQRALRRLAVFRGGLEREAAEQVAGASVVVLAALVDKSLLRLGATIAGTSRFELHELVRQYAEQQLHAVGEAEDIQRKHAGYYLSLAETTEQRIWRSEQATDLLDRLSSEHDNLRAVLVWSVSARGSCELGLRLATALGRYWTFRANSTEAHNWLQSLLARHAREGAETGGLAKTRSWRYVRARALKETSAHLEMYGLLDVVKAYLAEALVVFEELGDTDEVAQTLWNLGHTEWTCGSYAAAAHYANESQERYKAVENTTGVGWALWLLCNIAREQVDLVRAHQLAEAALVQGQRSGHPILTAYATHSLSRVQLARGALHHAHAWAEEALARGRQIQHPVFIAHALLQRGRVAAAKGDAAAAIVLWEESLPMAVNSQAKRPLAEIQLELGWAELWRGNHERARGLLVESLRWYEDRGHPVYLAECLTGLVAVELAEAITAASATRAARLLGAVERLRGARSAVVRPTGEHDYHQTVDAVRAGLDQATFAVARAEGQSMCMDQLVAGVLALSSEELS